MKILEALLLNESIVDDLRNSLVKGLKPEYGPGTETYNNLLKEFEKIASWAKNRLRKGEDENSAVDNSKVVWLLTWWILDTKLHFILTAQGLSGRADSPEHSSLMQYNAIFTDKEIQKVENKAKQAQLHYQQPGDRPRGIFPENSADKFVVALVHFLGTEGVSQKVREMPLKPTTTPLQALEEWKNIEDDWLQQLKDEERSIFHPNYKYQPENTLKPMIKFPDGSAWFNLDRPFCKEEGQSMGHCGNTATYNEYEDTIFSYRSPHLHKTSESGDHWIPHLTFIYNKETGMLGEMKGYGNQKPRKKYHEVIKTLIMDDKIKGIVGGGYMPESNFSVWDLDDAHELVEKKPLLSGDNLRKYVEMVGIDDTLTKLVHNKMGDGARFVPLPNQGRDTRTQMVRLTDEYPNFFQLIEKEFSDAPYVHMISAAMEGGSWGMGSGEYDFEQQAIDLSEEDDMDDRTNHLIGENDPIIKQIIIDELVHYSDGAPMDSIWDTLQEYGGEFSDWLNTSLLDASRTGWSEGIISALLAHAIRTIENSSSGYMGYGGKDVELEVQMEKSSPELEENKCSINAPIEEVLDVITSIDEHNDELGWDWWTPYAVAHEGGEEWDDDWKEDIYWDRMKATQEFNTNIDNAPKLHTGEQFKEKYDRLKEETPVKENKKVFGLAQMLTNTNGEKAHAKLHKVCARLGLSKEQCHAITSKAGYT